MGHKYAVVVGGQGQGGSTHRKRRHVSRAFARHEASEPIVVLRRQGDQLPSRDPQPTLIPDDATTQFHGRRRCDYVTAHETRIGISHCVEQTRRRNDGRHGAGRTAKHGLNDHTVIVRRERPGNVGQGDGVIDRPVQAISRNGDDGRTRRRCIRFPAPGRNEHTIGLDRDIGGAEHIAGQFGEIDPSPALPLIWEGPDARPEARDQATSHPVPRPRSSPHQRAGKHHAIRARPGSSAPCPVLHRRRSDHQPRTRPACPRQWAM